MTMAYANPMIRFPKALIISKESRRPSWVTSTALPRWNAAKINHTTELENPSKECLKDSLAALHSKVSPVKGFTSPHKRHSVILPVAWSLHSKDWVSASSVSPVRTNIEISTLVVINAKMQLHQTYPNKIILHMSDECLYVHSWNPIPCEHCQKPYSCCCQFRCRLNTKPNSWSKHNRRQKTDKATLFKMLHP